MRLWRAVALATAWCSADAAQPADAPARALDITDGSLPSAQRLISATQGDRLRWRITSNSAGALHLHAYRLNVTVSPGQPAELAFTAHAGGRFRIDWHPAVAAARPNARPNAVHAPPLALLEVRPR